MPSIAIKVFRDGQLSANLVALNTQQPQTETSNPFFLPMTNQVSSMSILRTAHPCPALAVPPFSSSTLLSLCHTHSIVVAARSLLLLLRPSLPPSPPSLGIQTSPAPLNGRAQAPTAQPTHNPFTSLGNSSSCPTVACNVCCLNTTTTRPVPPTTSSCCTRRCQWRVRCCTMCSHWIGRVSRRS